MAIKKWYIVGLATLSLFAYSSAITIADDDGGSSGHQFKWDKPSTKKKAKRPRPSRARKRKRKSASSTQRRARRATRTFSGMPPKGETRFKREEVIVRFRLRSRQASREALAQRLNLSILEVQNFALAGFTAHRYLVQAQRTLRQTIVELERSTDVVYAQPNYIYELQKDSSTKAKPNYAFKRMSLGPVHQTTRGSKVKIAVIDSGIDRSHPELASAKIASHDLRDQKEEDMDQSHGTSIAGIIGAQKSIAGVAPDADIIGISAFATASDGKTRSNSWVISKSMDLAHKLGAKVFNLSFAGPGDPIVRRALKKARQEGIVAIAAAGNAGPKSAPLYPAGYRTVIAVSATDVKDAIYENANRGKYITLSAPGVQILTLAPKASYRMSSGTSISTAYVSGLSALLLSANPKLGRDTIERILKKSSIDLGKPGRDEIFGVGIPDAVEALKRASAARK